MNQSAISDWLYDRRGPLALELTEVAPSADFLDGWFSVGVSFVHHGHRFDGHANARRRPLALEKASAEAIERVAVAHAGATSSTGFAAHVDHALARLGARCELIERDAFICNFFSDLPFYRLTKRQRGGVGAAFRRLFARLARRGVQTELCLVQSDHALPTVLCALFGRDHRPAFGLTIGLGTARNLRAAIAKAVLEAFTVLLPVLCGAPFQVRSERELARAGRSTPEDHIAFGLHPDTGRAFHERIEPAPKRRRGARVPAREFAYAQAALPSDFRSCPIEIVRATAPGLQELFLGPSTRRHPNQNRMREYLDNLGSPARPAPLGRVHFFG